MVHDSLQARRQRSDETLMALSDDIEYKTRLAYPDVDTNTLEDLAVMYFCGSLAEPEMKLSVCRGRPTTLTQALSYAIEYDSIVKSTGAESRNLKKP